MYAYNHYTKINASNEPTDGFESPFPNVFFSAPQVHSVSGACTDAYGKELFKIFFIDFYEIYKK